MSKLTDLIKKSGVSISLFLRGILIGVASLGVPGLSASTIAIVLCVYYDLIYSISHIFKEPRKSLSFLCTLLAGYGIGCIGGAWAVNQLYELFPIPVIAAVLGFLIGSIPRMVADSKEDFKNIPNIIVMLVVGAIFLVYSLVITNGNVVSFEESIRFPLDYIIMFFVGVVTSATLVIPGVDFAVTLMALGYYYAFIGLVGNLYELITDPRRLFLLVIYLVGYGIGSFFLSKGLRFLIQRFPRQLHCVNIAMIAVAPVIVIEKCIVDNPNPMTALSNIGWQTWVWAFLLFAAGYFAFTWVPMLLRSLGFIPKNADKVAEKEMNAARNDIPKECIPSEGDTEPNETDTTVEDNT